MLLVKEVSGQICKCDAPSLKRWSLFEILKISTNVLKNFSLEVDNFQLHLFIKFFNWANWANWANRANAGELGELGKLFRIFNVL